MDQRALFHTGNYMWETEKNNLLYVSDQLNYEELTIQETFHT